MDETTIPERPPFGALLRRLRLAAALSQEALAERARISVEAISALERGARRAPQRQTLELLAEALGLDAQRRMELVDAARRSAPSRLPRGDERAAAPPLPLAPLHGRDDDLAALLRALDEHRLVTVWGPPGVGKTRLALEAAQRVAERFPDGVTFVDLATVDDPARVAAAVVASAGARESADRTLAEALAERFARRRALLVLDTCEHVLEACGALASALLVRAPDLRILATSREPLRVPGETVRPLGPLPARDAAAFFLERVERGGGAPPAPEETAAVGELCAKLDGIPLALELAAARARAMSVAQIAAGLEERFSLLSRGARTAASRQQTLRATLDWSFRLLDGGEALVFRRLGVLAGEWTVADAVAVVPERGAAAVADAVHGLVDRALVAVAGDAAERRYRLLDTLRAYARERLRESGEIDEAERRNAERAAALAAEVQDAWRGDDVEGIARFGPRAPGAESALDWALRDGNAPELAALLAARLSAWWDAAGRQIEGLRRLDAALAALGDTPSAARVEAWNAVARLARRIELHERALAAAVRAAELAEAFPERPDLRAWTSLNRAQNEFNVGSPGAGERALATATALFRALGDEAGLRSATTTAATAALERGRFAEARALFDEAVRGARGRDQHRFVAQHLLALAEAEYACGETGSALAHAAEALAGARAVDDERIACCALLNRAAYLLAAGDDDDARATAHDALIVAAERRYGVLRALALQYHAALAARAGRHDAAAALLGYVDRVLAASGMRRGWTEERDAERTRAVLRATLGDDALAAASERGARLDEAEAIALAAASA